MRIAWLSPLSLASLLALSSTLHAEPAAPVAPASPPAAAPTGNTAIIPVGKLEKDMYDWDQRHAAILAVKDQVKPQVVLIGDSITHFWPVRRMSQGQSGQGSLGRHLWRSAGPEPRLWLGSHPKRAVPYSAR
ncbi:hypothetical protein [Verrucomicrobium spinosum]|uniref:hypothetical protein n=1 Tax=Verrucomicrobium spinosum TaxID=2736 RepID=UPI000A8DC393|nr:hypothetical protein [Verrucomicrobium spinosum]